MKEPDTVDLRHRLIRVETIEDCSEYDPLLDDEFDDDVDTRDDSTWSPCGSDWEDDPTVEVLLPPPMRDRRTEPQAHRIVNFAHPRLLPRLARGSSVSIPTTPPPIPSILNRAAPANDSVTVPVTVPGTRRPGTPPPIPAPRRATSR